MNEDRRKAFSHRIIQIIGDYEKQFGFFKRRQADDLLGRMLSALEDAFQTGMRHAVTALELKIDPFAPTGKDGPSVVLGAFTEEEIAKAADRVAERYEPKEP